jgi:hypothetical protein
MASVAFSLAYWHSLATVLVGTMDTTSRETFHSPLQSHDDDDDDDDIAPKWVAYCAIRDTDSIFPKTNSQNLSSICQTSDS